jgi:hypothetical protein
MPTYARASSMRHFTISLGAGILLALLAGCGSRTGNAEWRDGEDREPAKSHDYPPGAAAVLSVFGSGTGMPKAAAGPLDAATDCVVALRTVRTLIGRLPERPSQQQLAVLDGAEKAYLDRARAAADKPDRVANEIEQKLQSAQDAPTSQAQRALACVKGLS